MEDFMVTHHVLAAMLTVQPSEYLAIAVPESALFGYHCVPQQRMCTLAVAFARKLNFARTHRSSRSSRWEVVCGQSLSKSLSKKELSVTAKYMNRHLKTRRLNVR